MWKLIRQKLPTLDKLRKIGININKECPLCKEKDEDINYLFNQYKMVKTIQTNINTYSLTPSTSDIPFVDWIGHIQK